MKSIKTRIAAAATILGLGGLAGLALNAGGHTSPQAVATKPLVRTEVIRRTIHVTKHAKPKHPIATAPPAAAAPPASASAVTTGASGAAPEAVTTSSSGGGEAPVTTAASGTGGEEHEVEYESEGGGGVEDD